MKQLQIREMIGKDYSNLEKKSKKDLVLSEKPLKIGEFHYFWDIERCAGVARVKEANKAGMELYYPNSNIVYIGGSFDDHSLKGQEKRKVDLDYWEFSKYLDKDNEIAKRCVKKLTEELIPVTKDLNGLIGENLERGISWIVSKAFRNFSNQYDKGMIYRNHDWIINYGKEIKSFFGGFENPPFDLFPDNSNVIQTSLTSSIKRQIEEYYPGEVQILKNSVICDDFVKKDDGKDEKLKEIFLREGIMEEGMNHSGYPVRPDERKNLEEALYDMKVLEYVTGKKHKLIVPLSPNNEAQKQYTKEVKEFANIWNIPFSIGEASKYLDDENFNVGNFYHICDLAITTAIIGGFEYAYVEAPMSGTPLIGRRIREVCEDFEFNGMKMKKSLYDSSILRDGKGYKRRLANLNNLLKDKGSFKESVKKLDLGMRLNYSKKYLEHNAKVVREVYGHDVVAKDLIKMLKLPGYQKLK